jgi:thiamine kinase-like enzyme
MGFEPGRIEDLRPLPGGLTNRSFTFRLDAKTYVLRLPGADAVLPGSGVALPGADAVLPGSDAVLPGADAVLPGSGVVLPGSDAVLPVNRDRERQVYQALRGTGLTDEVVAQDQAGRRVTVFYEAARVADPADDSDLALAMGLLGRLHRLRLPLSHRFDLAGHIRRYERLCRRPPMPPYPRLERQSRRTAELLELHRSLGPEEVFCHCDAVAGNVLILPDGEAKLIDWEYAARADPFLDVATHCLHSGLERDRVDLALRLYLGRKPAVAESARLYLHLAVLGHTWALWAHLLAQSGADQGEYGARVYAYALDYYPVAVSLAASSRR